MEYISHRQRWDAILATYAGEGYSGGFVDAVDAILQLLDRELESALLSRPDDTSSGLSSAICVIKDFMAACTSPDIKYEWEFVDSGSSPRT